jgi:hypothetical protein
VKVDVRFRDILKIWWTYCVVDFFRSLLAIVAVNINSKTLAHIYQVLFLNDFLGVAAVIILHAYRFQHSGKWCSGDFLAPELARVQRDGYLIERGKILLGLVMYVWVGLLTYVCVISFLRQLQGYLDISLYNDLFVILPSEMSLNPIGTM